MKLVKNWKLACASLLAVCCMGTAAAGFALAGKTATASAAAADNWDGLPGSTIYYGDELAIATQDSAFINKSVDITQLPGKTGVFYIYYTNSVAWSGFSFRNGNNGCGYSWILDGASATAFPWHSVCFEGQNNHMILQDNRNFSGAGTFGGLNGTQGENFKNGLVPVEVHLGEGKTKGDASYIKIGGVELLHEQTNEPVTQANSRETGNSKELTADLFPDGCYLAINYNQSGAEPKFAVTEPGSVLALNASMDITEQQQVKAFSKDLTMDLSSAANVFGEGYTVTTKLNGKVLSSVTPEITKGADNKHATFKLTKEQLNAIDTADFETLSFFTFTFENGGTNYGTVAVALNILFEDPPVLEESQVVLEGKTSFTVSFTYNGVENPLTGTSVVFQTTSTSPEVALTKDTDFSVAKDGTKYTITFTEAAAEKLFDGHASAIVQIKLGKHKLRVDTFIDGATTEWGVRYRQGIDYVDGTLVQDKFYSTATLSKHNPATGSTRIFYENSVDVTKPIFIEYATLDVRVQWMLISLMSTPTISEFFSNTTSAEEGNIISFIMFGGQNGEERHDMQGMNDTFTDGNTVSFEQNTNMKNNVIEIKLGETNAADGYIKVNGETINRTLNKSQADYPNGKAYVGLFYNTPVEFEATINTHVNPVAITAPQDDDKYAMDLADAKDFTVTLANTSGKLQLSDENGAIIPADKYSYADGELTIQASYFAGKSFSREGQIFIWDTEKETGTAFKMAYTSSGMSEVKVGFATKGALTDVVFDLGDTAEIGGVQQNGEAIAAEKYSFANGKLTIKAAALSDAVGLQEFLVSAGSKLYPCIVCVNEWADGYVCAEGASINGKVASLSGVSSMTQAATYDLTAGIEFSINFKTIATYYERGVNESATSVTLRFLDPFSKNTLVITVYANFADDKITSSNQALFIDYSLVSGEGNKLAGGSARPVAPTEGANSATGVHTFSISESNGGLTLKLAGRPYNLSATALKGFNLKTCILSVTSEKSVEGSAAEVTFGAASATTPGTSGEGEESGGCGSVISVGAGVAIAVGVIAVAATAVLVVRKKRD